MDIAQGVMHSYSTARKDGEGINNDLSLMRQELLNHPGRSILLQLCSEETHPREVRGNLVELSTEEIDELRNYIDQLASRYIPGLLEHKNAQDGDTMSLDNDVLLQGRAQEHMKSFVQSIDHALFAMLQFSSEKKLAKKRKFSGKLAPYVPFFVFCDRIISRDYALEYICLWQRVIQMQIESALCNNSGNVAIHNITMLHALRKEGMHNISLRA